MDQGTTNRDRLDFGILLQSIGENASPETIARLSRAAEENGFTTVWTGDHITFPVDMPETYPFSHSGKPPAAFRAGQNILEVFQTLSFAAAKTSTIHVGTNVCLAPLRHPVILTQQAFTLEALSSGRFEFGIAAGWIENEYAVVDVPYEERGPRLDEFLDIFETARTEEITDYEGQFYSFEEIGFAPTPATPDRPPIWIGGKSGATFRRVAEYGDGWTIVQDRPDEVEHGVERLRRAWDDYDREGSPEVAVSRPVHVGTDAPVEPEKILVGESDDVVSDLRAYSEAGTTQFVLNFFTADVDEQIEQIERFGDQIIPAFEDSN